MEKTYTFPCDTLLPLQILLIVLKIGGAINCSWGWTMLPLWATVAIFAALLLYVTVYNWRNA